MIFSSKMQGEEKKSPSILSSHIIPPLVLSIAKMLFSELFSLIQPLKVAPISKESVSNGEETTGPKLSCHKNIRLLISRQNTLPVNVETYKIPPSKTGEETTGP